MYVVNILPVEQYGNRTIEHYSISEIWEFIILRGIKYLIIYNFMSTSSNTLRSSESIYKHII